MEVAVVMPVYNEEANIAAVVNSWLDALARLGMSHQILCIDDGSRDGTPGVLRELAARHEPRLVVLSQPNAGHGLACRRGYEQSVAESSAWTLQIDSDGQCDPRFLDEFWKARSDADCVFGLRTSRDDGGARALLSSACRLLASTLSGVDLRDANVPFRLMRTSVLDEALKSIPADFEMQNVALTVTLKRNRGLRWKYVQIHFRERQGGTNSLNLRRVIAMGWRLLRTMSKLNKPSQN